MTIFLGNKKFTLKKARATSKNICMHVTGEFIIQPAQQNDISSSMYY